MYEKLLDQSINEMLKLHQVGIWREIETDMHLDLSTISITSH
jgi:hypothetical protein